MSTATEFLSTYVIKPSDLSDTQFKQLVKCHSYIGSEDAPPRLDVDAVVEQVKAFYSKEYGGAVGRLTLRELFENYEATAVQADLIPGKVMDVIGGTYGLNKGFQLIKPILIGITDEGTYKVVGGRHRISAGVSILANAGLSYDEILDTLSIPVFYINDDSLLVIADNKSRGATQAEVRAFTVSSYGINVSNSADLVTDYVAGKFPGTATSAVPVLITLLFFNEYSPSGEVPATTPDTKSKVVSSVYSMFKTDNKDVAKLMVASNKNLDVQLIADVTNYIVANYEAALNFAIKEMNVSNLAREYKVIASRLYTMMKADIKSGNLQLPEIVSNKVKASDEAVDKVKGEKKSRKPRNKKAATTEVPPATVPAEGDVTVIVSQ